MHWAVHCKANSKRGSSLIMWSCVHVYIINAVAFGSRRTCMYVLCTEHVICGLQLMKICCVYVCVCVCVCALQATKQAAAAGTALTLPESAQGSRVEPLATD